MYSVGELDLETEGEPDDDGDKLSDADMELVALGVDDPEKDAEYDVVLLTDRVHVNESESDRLRESVSVEDTV